MAPPRKKGSNNKGSSDTDFSLGDLVLAKVKGFPAWPAKISRPEEWEHTPDPKKYFVQFFGTQEIAFVAPVDIQPFTAELKRKLQARSKGKAVKYFTRAVDEICEAFEESGQNMCVAFGDSVVCNPDDSSSLEGVPANGVVNDIGPSGEVVGNASSGGSTLERCSIMQEGTVGKNMLCAGELRFSKAGVAKYCLATPHSDDETNGGKKEDMSVFNEGIQSKGTSVSPYGGVDSGDDQINRRRSPSDKQKSSTNGYRSKVFNSERKRKFDHDGSSVHGVVLTVPCSKSDKHLSGYEVNNLMKDKKTHGSIKIYREDAFASSKDSGETLRPKQKDSSHIHSESNPVGSSVRSDSSKRKKSLDLVNDAKRSSLKNERRDSLTMPSDVHPDEAVISSLKRHRGTVLNTMSDPSEPATDDRRSSLSSFRESDVTKKRRAIRLYDDAEEEDDAPKTPIHGISAHKLNSSSIPESSQTKIQIQGNRLIGQGVKGSNKSGEVLGKPSASSAKSCSDSTSVCLPDISDKFEKVHSPSPQRLDTNNQMPDSFKVEFVSPIKSSPCIMSSADKNLEEQRINKHQVKVSANVSHSKGQTMFLKGLNLGSDGSNYSQPQVTIKKSRQFSSGEKTKVAPKSQGEGDSSCRLEKLRDSSLEDSKMDNELSMKHLIAAAQAKRKQAEMQNLWQSNMVSSFGAIESPSFENQFLSGGSNLMQEVHSRTTSASPSGHASLVVSQNQGIEVHDDKRSDLGNQGSSRLLSGGTDAAVARDAFEGMIETLTRTKESIGRATRLAVDCAKYGIANEVVDLLIRKLGSEPNFHRKVDIFFLVDSITQFSHSQRGIAGPSYVSIVQAALPRILGAAAPAGPSARENRRQCLKVLRLWLERKILPESVLRRYMDDIGASNDEISYEFTYRRPSRAERSVDDPIRGMEGMLVDEYGSNATFQLPGFFSSHAFVVDEEDEEDMLSTPCLEVKVEFAETLREPEASVMTPNDKHHHILEDVDVELEMEDVSGHERGELAVSTSWSPEINEHEQGIESEKNHANVDTDPMTPEGSPPLPLEPPPPLPPLPSSPPPPLPPSCPPSPPPPPPSPPTQPNFPSLPNLVPSPPVHPPLPPQLSFPSQVSSHHSTSGPSPPDMYIISQLAQPNQMFQPSHSEFSQGPFHSIPPHNIRTPFNQFPYSKPTFQQHLEHPRPHSYTSPSLGDRQMALVADDHIRASGEYKADDPRSIWMNGGRAPSCSTKFGSAEGYHRPPFERPPSNISGFQYSAPKMVVQPGAPVPGHGNSHILPSRADRSNLNCWRPT